MIAPQAAVDVVTINPFKYEIRFYHSAQAVEPDGGEFDTFTGSPHTVWRIENADASPGTYNRFRVTRVIGGTETVSEMRETVLGTWVLTEGNGLRETTRIVQPGPGANQETVITTVRNGDGVISSKKKEVLEFPWGRERILEILVPTTRR